MDTVHAAKAVAIPVEEEFMKRTANKVEADFSMIKTRIHRYPSIFRRLISIDDSYFIPRVVAIGPYHHTKSHLKQAEEVKCAATYYFCRDLNQSVEAVYQKILSVASNARSCYAHDAVSSLSEADFAAIMLRDGCFLLLCMCISDETGCGHPWFESWYISNFASVVSDIFLLENQLPWLVLDALVSFRSIPVGKFIAEQGYSFDAYIDFGKRSPLSFHEITSRYKPPHLLGLLRTYQSGLSIDSESSSAVKLDGITTVPQCSSAIELAEMGIKVVSSNTSQFKYVGIHYGILFAELFLAPVVIDDQNACWLINMVALETCMVTNGQDERTVTAYVSLLASLMSREEDVHELRLKGILHGDFSDQRTLAFFKNLVNLSDIPNEQFVLLAKLDAYKSKRSLWIAVHKFVYKNFKTILTMFPIVGVLVGIFKTLLSIKQHQP